MQGDVLHSTTSDDDYIVPRLSLFRIRLALLKADKDETFLISQDADDHLRKLVDMDSELDWSGFEKYVANFEALRHCLFALRGVDSRTVGQLYPGAIVGQDKSILDFPIPISSRHSVEYLTEPFVPSIQTAAANKNKVLVPRSGNAGCDVVIPFGGDSFIFLECRYSATAGSSTVADAIKKHGLTDRSIQKETIPGTRVSDWLCIYTILAREWFYFLQLPSALKVSSTSWWRCALRRLILLTSLSFL
jgi:hypothetical protein